MKHRYHINLLIDSELDIDKVKELFELNCGTVERIKMSEFTSEKGEKRIGIINDKKYPKKLYCSNCKKKTIHRVKLGAVQHGCMVCNECDTINQNKDE